MYVFLIWKQVFASSSNYCPTPSNFLTDIVLFADAEVYLVDGLQNENLSARAREEREMILFNFQHIKARFVISALSSDGSSSSGGSIAGILGPHQQNCRSWHPISLNRFSSCIWVAFSKVPLDK